MSDAVKQEGEPRTIPSLLEMYETALRLFADAPDEAHLAQGYELGQEAADADVGLLQLSEAHHRVLGRMAEELTASGISDAECMLRMLRTSEFFTESLASFEVLCQGYRSQIAILEEQERQLIEAQNSADRANQARNEFLSGMSHELRTPLNAIIGFGQLLEMDNLSDEQREAVGYISNAGARLLDVIDEVLNTSASSADIVTTT